jgi:hypothetical protein
MRTDPRAAEVRGIVEKVFLKYWKAEGAGLPCPASRLAARFPRVYEPEEDACETDFGQDPPQINETVLIDQGRYVARSYRIEGYLAMWLVAVGILQFYDDCGRMLATINLFETLRPKRMAA